MKTNSPQQEKHAFPAFADLKGLHPLLASNLEVMGLERQTEIQAKTWEAASSGRDVLGRARTGTGKVSYWRSASEGVVCCDSKLALPNATQGSEG